MDHLPDSWWDKDLVETEIDLDAEARQILLFELQSRPEICPTVMSERLLMSRDADHIRPILGGNCGVTVSMIPFSSDEMDVFDESDHIDSDDVAAIFNGIPRTYRKRLARMVDEAEEVSRRESALLFASNDDGVYENAEERERAEEFMNGMRLSQAQTVAALILGEL